MATAFENLRRGFQFRELQQELPVSPVFALYGQKAIVKATPSAHETTILPREAGDDGKQRQKVLKGTALDLEVYACACH